MSTESVRIVKFTKIFLCEIVWIDLFRFFIFALIIVLFSFSILVIIYG